MRFLALVLAFAVTALFSMVPFKVPRVFFFPPNVALHTPATTDPGLQAPPAGAEYQEAGAMESVYGRQDLPSDQTALLPAAPLFAGVRTQAGLSPWKARRIALPPRIHIRLRAPPVIG